MTYGQGEIWVRHQVAVRSNRFLPTGAVAPGTLERGQRGRPPPFAPIESVRRFLARVVGNSRVRIPINLAAR